MSGISELYQVLQCRAVSSIAQQCQVLQSSVSYFRAISSFAGQSQILQSSVSYLRAVFKYCRAMSSIEEQPQVYQSSIKYYRAVSTSAEKSIRYYRAVSGIAKHYQVLQNSAEQCQIIQSDIILQSSQVFQVLQSNVKYVKYCIVVSGISE